MLSAACCAQITYSYEGEGHELRRDQAAMDYGFMLSPEDDPRLFHIDALASQGQPSGNEVCLSFSNPKLPYFLVNHSGRACLDAARATGSASQSVLLQDSLRVQPQAAGVSVRLSTSVSGMLMMSLASTVVKCAHADGPERAVR